MQTTCTYMHRNRNTYIPLSSSLSLMFLPLPILLPNTPDLSAPSPLSFFYLNHNICSRDVLVICPWTLAVCLLGHPKREKCWLVAEHSNNMLVYLRDSPKKKKKKGKINHTICKSQIKGPPQYSCFANLPVTRDAMNETP